MKKFLMGILPALALAACANDLDPADFSAEELRDLTPIMQFKGNPIPDTCYNDNHIEMCDRPDPENGCESFKPHFRLECHYYFENYGKLYSAIEEMGWKYDDDAGDRGDCGPKHEYTKSVGHRKLHLYVKTCNGDDWLVSYDRILFHVEYD